MPLIALPSDTPSPQWCGKDSQVAAQLATKLCATGQPGEACVCLHAGEAAGAVLFQPPSLPFLCTRWSLSVQNERTECLGHKLQDSC